MEKERAIVDFSFDGNANGVRDALYSAIQDRVMAHIETKKMEIAQNLIQPEQPEVEDTVAQ